MWNNETLAWVVLATPGLLIATAFVTSCAISFTKGFIEGFKEAWEKNRNV